MKLEHLKEDTTLRRRARLSRREIVTAVALTATAAILLAATVFGGSAPG